MPKPVGPAWDERDTCPHLENGLQLLHAFLGITNGKPVFQRNQSFPNLQRVIHALGQRIDARA
jgi:hypothetical protein